MLATNQEQHDGGKPAVAAGKAPVRQCIVTGQAWPRAALVRFVVGPEGTLVADVAGRLPGRGLWIHADRDSVATAVARNLFAKSARRAVKVADGLADSVEEMLAQRGVDLLGMARRAGQTVAGFEKVRAWLNAGRVELLLAAADGAADGRAKLRALAGEAAVLEVLRADELAAAFGRGRVVHVAIAAGALAAKIEVELTRLAGFRPPAG